MQIKTETKVGLFVIVSIAVFMFMILGIGAFRFSSSGYKEHTIEFEDVSGLSRQAEVKIAGVKVGWVEDLDLIGTEHKVRAIVMVNKKYKLYANASAVVRQEGLIGTKFLEITPGDPLLPTLDAGDTFTQHGRESVSVDELLSKFKMIANNVERITSNISEAFDGADRAEQLKSLVTNLSSASEKIDNMSKSLERVVTNNEENMQSIIADVRSFAQTLREDLPTLKSSASQISDSLSQAADEARTGFSHVSSVAEKINDGQGLLGKLVNEDEMYQDLKFAVNGLKNYLAKFENIGIVFNSHFESMYRPVYPNKYKEAKGYFSMRIHTSDDFFYQGQLVSSDDGFWDRSFATHRYYNLDGTPLDIEKIATDNLNVTDPLSVENYARYAGIQEIQTQKKLAFGFQIGKIYKDLALRTGIFEGTFGVGVDYFIPFNTDKFAWTTSFEAFDFRGLNRFDRNENRPHLKWLNRIYVLNNFYLAFGVDDFVSKNANPFYGIGICFGDDDIKYLLSKFGLYLTV